MNRKLVSRLSIVFFLAICAVAFTAERPSSHTVLAYAGRISEVVIPSETASELPSDDWITFESVEFGYSVMHPATFAPVEHVHDQDQSGYGVPSDVWFGSQIRLITRMPPISSHLPSWENAISVQLPSGVNALRFEQGTGPIGGGVVQTIVEYYIHSEEADYFLIFNPLDDVEPAEEGIADFERMVSIFTLFDQPAYQNETPDTAIESETDGFDFPLDPRDGSSGRAPSNMGYNVRNPSLQTNAPCYNKPYSQLQHTAEDYMRSEGSNVYATANGRVIWSQYANYPGAVVIIEHTLPAGVTTPWGNNLIYTMYGHLSTDGLISPWTDVQRGQVIGRVLYQTYYEANNSHVHFETRRYGDMSGAPRQANGYTLCPLGTVTWPGPGYTDTNANPDWWGYTHPSNWIDGHRPGGGGGGGGKCSAPSLNSPGDGETVSSNTITFRWNAVSGCTFNGYEFHVCTSSDGQSGCFINGWRSGTESTETITGHDNQDLWWTVSPTNAPNLNWASPRKFRIHIGGGGDGNWHAKYFDSEDLWWNTDLSGNGWLKCESDFAGPFIDKNWGSGTPCGGFRTGDNWVAEFRGTIRFPSGDYVFHIQHDDGVKLWFKGSTSGSPDYEAGGSGTTEVCDGQRGFHLDGDKPLRVLLHEEGGDARIRLTWDSDTSRCPRPRPPAPALNAPANNAVFARGANLNLSWNVTPNAAQYVVHFWGGPTNISPTTPDQVLSLGTGQWGGSYQWQVKGLNSAGEDGPWSETRTLTIKYGPPTNLQVTNTTSSDISMAWNPSADAPGNIDGYRVYRNGTLIMEYGNNVTTYTNSGLSCGASYVYIVKAFKGSVESDASNSITGTTAACPCYTLTTSVNPSGSGSITTTPAPNCGTKYTAGTSVQVRANPNPGYTFANWSGAVTGSTNPTTVTMNGDKSVTANFTQPCYTLTTGVNPSGSGSITTTPTPNCGTKYTAGTSVQVRANPNSGYTFANWSGAVTGSTNPTIVTMNGDKSVTANFTRTPTPPIVTWISPSSGQTITASSVQLRAAATGGTGGINRVAFSAKYGGSWHAVNTDSTAPYESVWDLCNPAIPRGDVELGLEVWDNGGNHWVYSEHYPNLHFTNQAVCSSTGLLNGGFEDGSGAPTGWTQDVWATGRSTLTWDTAQKHSGSKSVKIQSTQPNDARWIQTVNVTPNTNYRLSGCIKTENVAHATESVDAGANLSVLSAYERTTSLFGTNDWTCLAMTFNSGENSQVAVAARLGFLSGTTTGTAWFDDLQLEAIPPEGTCNPTANQIALYVDANYGGQCVVKGIGDYLNPAAIVLPDDAISSVKIGGNVKVKLCRNNNLEGVCQEFQQDDPNLSDNSIGDNQVSSAKVERRSGDGYSISLARGWNLISIPFPPADATTTSLLVGISGKYNLVYAYDSTDPTNPWRRYNPAQPPALSTLPAVSEKMGLWIRMTDPAVLTVQESDTPPPLPLISLKRGWNLVGYPKMATTPTTTALASIAGKYNLVYAYDATDPTNPWRRYNPAQPPALSTLPNMGPGRGYWIRATEDCEWEVQ